jgi:hypothetical protein
MTAKRKPGDPLSRFTIDLHHDQPLGLGAAQARAFEAAARFSTHALRAMLAAQTQALRFATERVSRDLETVQRLAQCRDGAEAMALMQAHGVRTVADYAEEATELMRLGSKAFGGETPQA